MAVELSLLNAHARFRCSARLLPVLAVLTTSGAPVAAQRPVAVSPHSLARADSILADATAREAIPGAVLVVMQGDSIIHERAFGYARLYDYGMQRSTPPRRMDTATIFDLASVTKVMATTYAIMLLADRGLIDIDAPAHRYLAGLRGTHLDSITVRHLLTHSAGLAQWQPLYYHAATPQQTYDFIRTLPLEWGVGQDRHYSDLGFMLLGYVVERVSGRPLDAFVQEELYAPLGLRATTFLPKQRGLTGFAATSHGNPYERRMVHDTAFGYDYDGDPHAWSGWREYTLDGEVNDGNAWHAHGGVAGHAGLFSTGRELAVLLNVLLDAGEHAGRRILGADVIAEFMRKDRFGHGLGWQIPRDAPDGSFAHSGFTGTYVIGVPRHDLAIVLLINRQNLGVNDAGYYPGMGVQQQVIRAILRGHRTSRHLQPVSAGWRHTRASCTRALRRRRGSARWKSAPPTCPVSTASSSWRARAAGDPRPASRPTCPSATRASASCVIRRAADSATRTSAARTADHATPSSRRCRTIVQPPRWRRGRCARAARTSTPMPRPGASMPSRSLASSAGRVMCWYTMASLWSVPSMRSRPRRAGSATAVSSQSRESAAITWRVTRTTRLPSASCAHASTARRRRSH